MDEAMSCVTKPCQTYLLPNLVRSTHERQEGLQTRLRTSVPVGARVRRDTLAHWLRLD